MTTDQTLSVDAPEPPLVPQATEEGSTHTGVEALGEHEEEDGPEGAEAAPPAEIPMPEGGTAEYQAQRERDEATAREEEARQRAQEEHMLLARAFLGKNKVINHITAVGNAAVKRVGDIIMQAVAEEVMSVEEGLRMTQHVRNHAEGDKAEVIRLHQEAIIERFTPDELRDLLAFLSSPLGEKLLDGLASARKELDPIMEKWAANIMEHAISLQKRIVQKRGPVEALLGALLGGGGRGGPRIEVMTEESLEQMLGKRRR